MNSRISMAAWVAVCWLAVGTVNAAEPVQQKAEASPSAAANANADKAREKVKARAAARPGAKDEKKPEQNCTATTGTRIRGDPRADCVSVPGQHTYTADEINATGEMNVSDALRKLDPRLQ